MSRSSHPETAARRAAINRIAADWQARCAEGESIPVADLLTSHPDLAPDLEEEIRRRAKIEAARAAANEAPPSAEPHESNSSLDASSPSHAIELEGWNDEGDEAPPVDIPGYKILRELHRGGQGVVYQAVQDGTKRKVAIKVLLEGPYASKSARRRFEREIEVAGQLKHANIISIFHSGQTHDGRQFCVMDYVRGTPLTEHVRTHHYSLEDAIELILRVCDAVQYAHQKGVIHRDLKPSNILVDCEGQPKVLDFGLAKLMLSAEEGLSVTGHAVGTPAYMSPEQVRGNPDAIDIRTDVYSIGVMLFQVLTGADPYPMHGSEAETKYHILETDPSLPEQAWTPQVGAHGRARKGTVSSRCPINRDLSTVVLKSLAKEREARYQSAGELAWDLRACLGGDPIRARRPSLLGQIRKVLRKHKVAGVAASLSFLLVLTAGIAIRINQLRNVENQLRMLEQMATKRENAFKLADQKEWNEAQPLFDEVLTWNPNDHVAWGNLARMRKDQFNVLGDKHLLDEALKYVACALQQDPSNDGLWNLKGVCHKIKKEYSEAVQCYEQAIKIDPARPAWWSNLGVHHALSYDFSEAERAFDEARTITPETGESCNAWRQLAALQFALGNEDCISSAQMAYECTAKHLKRVDADALLLIARVTLERGDLDTARMHEFAARIALTIELAEKLERMRAMIALHRNELEQAILYAQAALKGGDDQCINHLLIAQAEAKRFNKVAAQQALAKAMETWPNDGDARPQRPIAPKGVLWFERTEEMKRLKKDAEAAIAQLN